MWRFVVCILAALALPSAAIAKEVTMVTVCGQEGCRSTDDRDRLAALPVGGAPTGPPRASSFYRVTIHMRADRPVKFSMYFLPEQGLLRERPVHGSWMRPEPAQAAALAALAGGLTPFPAAQMPYARMAPPETTPVPVATPPATATRDDFPWWLIAVGGALALGLAAAVARAARHAVRLKRARPV
jgi:hypothetical protein